MAWNQPGNNGQDNDPWGNNNKKPSGSSGNLFDKIKNLLKKGNSGNIGGLLPGKRPISATKIGSIVIIALILIWGVSGFYTINQSQRGVITRFGQVQSEIIQPGLNWRMPLIDNLYIVDTQGTQNFNVKGYIVTTGENLVYVEMNVQYRINDPLKYLFNVTNVKDSLHQAADSALRTAVGSSNIDAIISDGRAALESSTKDELVNVITHYDMGINIVDLNFQVAGPPEQVQDAYDDAIRAQGDSEREIKQAEADKVQLIQQAEGRSARILADANAYKVSVQLEASGDVARFEKILPQYKVAPEITKERLYIETMEKILSKTNKVIINDKSGNLMVLPLEQLLKNKAEKGFDTSTLSNTNESYHFNMLNTSEEIKNRQETKLESQNSNKPNGGSISGNTTRTIGR